MTECLDFALTHSAQLRNARDGCPSSLTLVVRRPMRRRRQHLQLENRYGPKFPFRPFDACQEQSGERRTNGRVSETPDQFTLDGHVLKEYTYRGAFLFNSSGEKIDPDPGESERRDRG